MPKLAMPGGDTPTPPARDTKLDDFRRAWQEMVNRNRALEAKAAEIVALVESTPDVIGTDVSQPPDFLATFNRLESELLGQMYEGQRHIWHTTALASRLGERDRPVVESKVGRLFTDTGAL